MRDNKNGYNAWLHLTEYKDQMIMAIEDKDEEWMADIAIEILWILVNEHGTDKVFAAGDTEFIVNTETEANVIAHLLEAAGAREVNTGWYDPAEDERDGCDDELTGKWYVR